MSKKQEYQPYIPGKLGSIPVGMPLLSMWSDTLTAAQQFYTPTSNCKYIELFSASAFTWAVGTEPDALDGNKNSYAAGMKEKGPIPIAPGEILAYSGASGTLFVLEYGYDERVATDEAFYGAVPVPSTLTVAPEFTIMRNGVDFQARTTADTSVDFDASSLMHATPANTYIVTPSTGNDTTGDGSVGNPYATLNKAMSVAVNTDQITLTEGGIYPRAASFDPSGYTVGVNIKCNDTVPAILSRHVPGLEWAINDAENYPHVYHTTQGTIDSIVDLLDLDGYGHPKALTLRANVAAVEANAGSFYINGTDLYCRLHDDRAPADILVNYDEANASFTTGVKVYLENCDIFGGDQAFMFNNETTDQATLVAKDCRFSFGRDGLYGINAKGKTRVVLQDCQASYNSGHGINAVADGVQGTVPTVILIDPIVRNNGLANDDDCGVSITGAGALVTVMGEITGNIGANVQILTDAEGWMLGTDVQASAKSSATKGVLVTSDNVFLDRIYSFGNDLAVDVTTGKTVQIRRLQGDDTAGGAGTVATY